MGTFDLVLDPSIRNWVLLPIVYIMVLVGVGRSMAQQLMVSDNTSDIEIVKHRQLLMRSQRLRANGGFLTPRSFRMRKKYFNYKKDGKLRAKVQGGPPNPMENSAGMMEMMKGNMSMMVPNMVMMGWISFFFSGFVLVKLPFSLTEGFKEMLQRGVSLSSLDVSYVSSLSWYFLVMFGMRGLFTLILGQGKVMDDTKMMQAQMGMGSQQQDMQFDAAKQYKQEQVALKLTEPSTNLMDSEYTLLGLEVPERDIGAKNKAISAPKENPVSPKKETRSKKKKSKASKN
mmetsp:Transcript_4570/g.5293  ORF Transcript_4570/g.5293 Transcript_4570/m.5293 type:complete len:286 (+) Transcript_4570:181-1038(+)|eukprot:CAMPEP_0184054238 /NCGR_PEP_ID=MMETSP0956-20121227/6458_1 /TAXON_ID=627963 /ORGANISM="Aplanochytrium sp, Strain PBS07" /LENGTH=285 /DNA_ID=CAMNT_0026347825 /DNA_START=194 /DNA_END=1051 /DNA_ORIENTATION=-